MLVPDLKIKASDNVREFYINHKSAFAGDSGIDLFFPNDVVCPPRTTTLIDLEISCEMITSYYVFPRSSISKTPLIMHNSVGIIDKNYRNTIKVAVYNTSDKEYTIHRGDRLFQICAPDLRPITCSLSDELSSTTRGAGFGSSGTSGKLTQ
jgi:dUTP pyrophosphatase